MKKSKGISNQMDMLNGSIFDKILLFALPLAISSILQQLFNSVDVAVVGRFASSEALAAVGSNSSVISLLINLFVGISVGANVVIANYIGQGKTEKIQDAVHTVMIVSLISGVFLLVLGLMIARPILEIMGTPENVIDLAVLYLHIYFLGMPFLMIYNFGAAVLRSKGDTQRPLIALFIGGVINIILNLFFVVVLHMSVEGVAIGTVVSNIFSSMMLLYWLMHETDALRIDLKELKINGRILKRIAKIGVPAGLQGMVFSISNVCIQSSLNALGSDAIAASSAALNYEYFAYYILSSFAQAAVTFIGQNYSAKKYDRCKKITLQSFLLGGATTMVACMIFVIFDHFFISFFTSDASVASLAYTRMKIILPFQFLNMSIEVFSSVMRGVGYSSVPAGICVAGICGVRLAYLYTIYPSIASYDHLLIIYPISWFVTVLALALVYFIHVRPKVYHHQAAN